MKNTLFTYFMALSLHLHAGEWESYWVAAVEDCHQGCYHSAEQHFNMTIQSVENERNLEHPSIYVDRARLYLLTHKYDEALQDIQIALTSQKLSDAERAQAISIKVAARANLGFSDGYNEDMEFLAKNIKMDIEDTENHIIIKNMPVCKAFKKTMATFFVEAGICQSEDDIQLLPSNTCIVNKKPTTSDINKQLGRDIRLIEGCVIWCDSNALAAIRWCSFYPALCMVNACNKAVVEIQNNCRACCQNLYDQDVCAAPFGDIVAVMQKYLTNCGCN